MSLSVTWTDEAQDTFQQIITLIEDKWGIAAAQKFLQSVQKQPCLFKPSLIYINPLQH